MRIKVELSSQAGSVLLRTGFNANIQALIYSHLAHDDGEWLHNEGYRFEKRSFKFFSFSGIIERGRFDKTGKIFYFPQTVSFFINSPLEWIVTELAENLIRSERVKLGENMLAVSSISVMKRKEINSGLIRIKCITPIVNYTTFTTPEGKKKTHFYNPFEAEFSELTENNLHKKWVSLYRKDCPCAIKIRPLFEGNGNEKIHYFGTGEDRTLVKGWMGRYMLEGDPRMLDFAYDACLGSKNSQGFGMVELSE